MAMASNQYIVRTATDDSIAGVQERMRMYIQTFLTLPTTESSMCVMLLMAFFRSVVAPVCSQANIWDIVWWLGKYEKNNKYREKHSTYLITEFDSVMEEIKVSILHDIQVQFAYIFVLNWIVTTSPWRLPIDQQKQWNSQVVRDWFTYARNTEDAPELIKRAEHFLTESHGPNTLCWGAQILQATL